MSSILTYGAVVAIICFVAWISIKTAVKEAKISGAADAKAKASEEARKVEREMADELTTPLTNEEAKDKLRKGDI